MIARMAWRNLWRNRERSALMISAIAIAVCAMVFMVALTRGFMEGIYSGGISALPAHIQLHSEHYLDDPSIDYRLNSPTGRLQKALHSPKIERWLQRIKIPAAINSEYASRGVTLLGIEFDKERQDPRYGFTLSEGSLPTSGEVLIGAGLLSKLETRLGKRIVLMTQNSQGDLAERGFRISGVYQTNLQQREEHEIYVPLHDAQSWLKSADQVSEIAVFLNDESTSIEVQQDLANAAEPSTDVQRWNEIDAYLGASMQTMDSFIFIIVGVIFITLSFSLINTLITAIFERTREIGLLLALGLSPHKIVGVLSLESMLLITLGLILGNTFALLILAWISPGIDLSSLAEGLAMIGASPFLSAELRLNDWLQTNVLLLILGSVTSWLPALRAAKLNPVNAMQSL